MKNIYKYLLGVVAVVLGMSSCDSDEGVSPTVDLATMNFRATAQPGKILLEWDVPEGEPGYFYMKMHYFDPREKKDHNIVISPYAKSMVIENTRKRYGAAYDFTFTPYSETDTPGESFVLEGCRSEAAEVQASTERVPLNLKAASFAANTAQPGSSNTLDKICDGLKDTFYETQYGVTTPANRWIDVDLGEEMERFEIETWNRNAANNVPKDIKLYKITKLGDENVDMDQPFLTYTNPNKTASAQNIKMVPAEGEPALTNKVRYLRYCANGTKADGTFVPHWHLAEFSVSKVIMSRFDPEEDEKPIYDAQ